MKNINDFINKIIQGDALEILKQMPDECVDTIITSPPYWGLRDYGVEGQIGLEKTPEEYVEKLVNIFREARRVLKKTGTLWLNLGDSYAGAPAGNKGHIKNELFSAGSKGENYRDNLKQASQVKKNAFKNNGLKPKDLVGIPWRVAFALQQDGWYLRQDIIWAKPNPMPESVTDRCTKSHEYIFLLSKSSKYYFDNEAIKEKAEHPESMHIYKEGNKISCVAEDIKFATKPQRTMGGYVTRNKRDVWWISTKPFKGAHFATFPPDLVEPMILAGCPEFVCKKCGKPREKIIQVISNPERSQEGRTHSLEEQRQGKTPVPEKGWQTEKQFIGWTDCGCGVGFEPGIVLDPFIGSGTTAVVAKKLGRNYIGIELNPEYVKIAEERIKNI